MHLSFFSVNAFHCNFSRKILPFFIVWTGKLAWSCTERSFCICRTGFCSTKLWTVAAQGKNKKVRFFSFYYPLVIDICWGLGFFSFVPPYLWNFSHRLLRSTNYWVRQKINKWPSSGIWLYFSHLGGFSVRGRDTLRTGQVKRRGQWLHWRSRSPWEEDAGSWCLGKDIPCCPSLVLLFFWAHPSLSCWELGCCCPTSATSSALLWAFATL